MPSSAWKKSHTPYALNFYRVNIFFDYSWIAGYRINHTLIQNRDFFRNYFFFFWLYWLNLLFSSGLYSSFGSPLSCMDFSTSDWSTLGVVTSPWLANLVSVFLEAKSSTNTLVFLPSISPESIAIPTSLYLSFKIFFLCVGEFISAACTESAVVKFIARFSPTYKY